MNARYFYAPAIFSVVPKIYVLTEDLNFYTEVRDRSLVNIETQTIESFAQFNPTTQETEDYPIILEINQKEALETSLNMQSNWVRRYIQEKRIGLPRAKQA